MPQENDFPDYPLPGDNNSDVNVFAFSRSLKGYAEEIHQTAVEHGWWEAERNTGEMYMLMSSELSEAYEEWRDGKPHVYYEMNGTSPDKPEGEGIELADCLIRMLDYCHDRGIDLEECMRIKMAYNKTRPYRHGGKRS